MAERLRVACVVDMLDSARPSACGYLRLVLPLTKPLVSQAIDVRFMSPATVALVNADVVIVQRRALQTMERFETLLDRVRRIGARLVFEIDDDLLSLPADHAEFATYAPYQQLLSALAQEADEVWTSTPALAARFAARQAPVVVIENELDSRAWRPRPADPGVHPNVRLLFMGTRSHDQDLNALLKPAFAGLRRRFGAQLSLAVIGPEGFIMDGASTLVVPPETAGAYPSFAAWLQRHVAADIGVAPLSNSLFARSKSAIKWLEYSALGAAVVATAVGAYPAMPDGDGLVVAPSAGAIEDAIAALVADPARLQSMRRRACTRAAAMIARSSVHEPRLARLERLGGGVSALTASPVVEP